MNAYYAQSIAIHTRSGKKDDSGDINKHVANGLEYTHQGFTLSMLPMA